MAPSFKRSKLSTRIMAEKTMSERVGVIEIRTKATEFTPSQHFWVELAPNNLKRWQQFKEGYKYSCSVTCETFCYTWWWNRLVEAQKSALGEGGGKPWIQACPIPMGVTRHLFARNSSTFCISEHVSHRKPLPYQSVYCNIPGCDSTQRLFWDSGSRKDNKVENKKKHDLEEHGALFSCINWEM